MLILGGFTSIPGAIVGGLIIGIGEKIGEFYWGPLLGGGIESWLAYVIALVFLLFRPQGLFGEKIIDADRGFEKCFTAKPANTRRPTPPIWRCSRSGRTGSASSSFWSSRSSHSAVRKQFRSAGGDDPVPDLLARGDRAQHPDRLHRPALARHRRLHGRRRLCLLQAHDHLSRTCNIIVWIVAVGLLLGGASASLFGLPSLRIKGFYLAVATLAAQFFLPGASSACRGSYNYNVSGAIEVPTRTLFGVPITGPNATPVTRYLVVLVDRRR